MNKAIQIIKSLRTKTHYTLSKDTDTIYENVYKCTMRNKKMTIAFIPVYSTHI